jgi:hypothetical protein
MSNKFEKLIGYIINEDDAKAKALFHQIVVEHSRKIYEDLEAEEMSAEDLGDDITDHDDEISSDEEGFDDADLDSTTDDTFNDDQDTATDDDSGIEDRVMDLEDALDELKAEFDELLSQEEEEGHDFSGSDDEALDDADLDEDDEELADTSDLDEDDEELDGESEDEEPVQTESLHRKTSADLMREYVEKVTKPSNSEGEGNRTSPVAKKNDFGGTTKNIAQGGRESNVDGGPRAPTNAYAKGRTEVKGAGKFQNVAGGSKNLERVQRSPKV